MKTFVLFLISWLTWFGNEPKNTAYVRKSAASETCGSAPVVGGSFQVIAGDIVHNDFKKVLYHSNAYYAIGSRDNQAALSKFDDMGTLLWTRVVDDTSAWNDFIVNTDGNLLLVGWRDIQSFAPKDALVGVIEPSGNPLVLQSFDYTINEYYSSIVRNPLNTAPGYRYYVVGSINRTTNRNDDDVVVVAMNDQGVASARRRYGSISRDDEFHAKISVYNPVAGTFALSGNLGGTATYVVINQGPGTTTNQGRALGATGTLFDLQRTASGEYLGAAGFTSAGRIYKISGTAANNFYYESTVVSGLRQILSMDASGFYTVGKAVVGGNPKPVTMFCRDNGSNLTLYAAKYPLICDNPGAGFLARVGLTDLAYVDGRINAVDGFGNGDGYLAAHIGGFDDCEMDSLPGNFQKRSLNPVISQPGSYPEVELVSGLALSSSLINYSVAKVCDHSCFTEFTYELEDDCGNVHFTGTTNLTGSVTYCWDFGDAPPCGSTLQDPDHTYASPGMYQVCLTVANGLNQCTSCQSVVVQQSDHIAPDITCPPAITLACDDIITPDRSGYPTVSDNLDPVPVVSYNDLIVVMTSCYKEITRVWTAVDYCGNSANCQQRIVQSDDYGPAVNCPPSVTIDCTGDRSPAATGFPFVLFDCNGYSQTYVDNVISGPCPQRIEREWTLTDDCGNSTVCLQEIIITDLTPPVFSECSRKFTAQGLNIEGGPCQAEFSITTPAAFDDCDPATVITNDYNNTGNASGTYPEGTTLVTWTATDECGNTATCVDTVCVLPCAACPDTCLTNVLNISTGYDPISDVLLNPLSVTSAWQLVTTPVVVDPYTPSVPAPAYVIQPYGSAWATQTGSQWISAYPFASLQADNASPLAPYTLQNCFCVCQNSSLVTIEMGILVDNAVVINLCDDAGNFIINLASITTGSTASFTSATNVFQSVVLNEGNYCIKAELRNLSGRAMGLNIQGSITGVGLLESVCCNQTNFITGHKFIDENCNGIRDASDPPGIGWEIELKDATGLPIETKITDGAGFYSFQDIPIGSYTVCELQQTGFTQSFPVGGTYSVDIIDDHTPIAFLNFGNCPIEMCCQSEEEFCETVLPPLRLFRESCEVKLIHSGLKDCQRMMIHWGDGSSSAYLSNLVSIEHNYPTFGDYTICVHFEELNENEEVCFQKDSCVTLCIECDPCVEEEIELQCFRPIADSYVPTTNETLGNISDAYIEHIGNGSYYAAGHFHNNYFDFPGGAVLTDGFVNKYDEECGLCWSLVFSGDASDQVLVVKKITGTNEFYVGGIFNSNALNLPSGGGAPSKTLTRTGTAGNIFLAKYKDADCSQIPELVWAWNTGNNLNRILLSDMDVDNIGDVVITGIFSGDVDFNPLGTPTLLTAIGGFYLSKYNRSAGGLNTSFPITLSSTTGGGLYPFGVTVDPISNDILIGGHYSYDIDFNGPPSDLTNGPVSNQNGAPFVARFDLNGNLLNAFPIISNVFATINSTWHQGAVTDIEAYAGGYAISVESYPPDIYSVNFDPIGNNSLYNFIHPQQTSYIVRYDDLDYAQCLYALPQFKYVTEISVDDMKNVYFLAGENVNPGDDANNRTGYDYHNILMGVVNNDCIAKTREIYGSRNDAGWSISPDDNKGFAIIGRTQSPDLDLNFDSNTDHSTFGDPDLFIATYSCICTQHEESTESCCDSLYITSYMLSQPEDTTCCYGMDLVNFSHIPIQHCEVNLLTPGWTFESYTLGFGFNGSAGTNTIAIDYPGGPNFPEGITSNFLEFCLFGIPGSSSTQTIEFVWYEVLETGIRVVSCRDTISTNCEPTVISKDCVQLINPVVTCNPENPYEYCLSFQVENLSEYTATEVILEINTSGFLLSDCSDPLYVNPLNIDLIPDLGPGETSTVYCVKILSNSVISSPQQVCLNLGFVLDGIAVCFSDSTYCLDVEPCCNPCDEVELVINPVNEIRDSCCFSLSLLNPCAYLYFNKIVVDFLPVGSDISLIQVDGSWTLTSLGSGSICLTYNAGYFPSGLLEDIIRFCYRDPVPGVIPSVTVHFFSDVSSTPPGTIVEVCSKSVEMECRCCPECEDNLVLNGSFQEGLVNGNIGGPGNVNNWTALTGTPQAVDYFGSCENGAVLMWGNAIVGESIFQNVNFDPCYTYEISYCARRHFNDGQEYIGEIRMKAVTTPLPIFPNCPSGNCEEIIPLPNGLTPNWEHFTVNWTPGRAYNSLIIQPWSSTTINNGANVSWIVIDDICIRIIDSCKCENHGELLVFNDQFSLNTSCNDQAILEIPCPENNVSFNIFSDLECTSDCASSIEWNITDPSLNIIVGGIIPLPAGGGSWGISGLPYSIFTEEVLYTLNINSICGCDTCICVKTFKINACDTCCGPHDDFVNVAQNAIQISVDDFKCKATLTFDEVDCNIQIISVKWKTGVISYGPFVPGDMVMYTYPSGNVSYLVTVHVVEYNANGEICNEADITYPVSLNCKKCCEKGIVEHKKWASLIAQGFQTTVNGCEVTVSAPQFGECYFFETSPDWGEPPAPLPGPFAASSSWTHTYSTSGSYTICVRVSEYPFGDPTLEPCRSKLMCTTVTVDCDGPCVCDGFTDLSFYFDKENKVATHCMDTLTLVCPPDDCIWIFSGNLLCKNDCPESLINWQLVDSYTSIPVASGTSVAFPGFGIYIPPAIVTVGGEYDLIIIGQCDPNALCPCRIHLSFPGCDEVCPCDPDDLVADVEKGIGKIQILNDCISCFSPMALTECDMVTWYKLPNLTTPIGSSLGNQLFCHDFKYPENYLIKMHVIRKNEDGSVCAEYEKIVSVIVNCTFPGPEFSNNCLFTSIDNSKWILFEDGNKTLTSKSNTNKFTLTGNLNSSSFILSSESICLEKSGLSIRLNANLNDQVLIKHGSRLVIAAVPSEISNQKVWENHVVLGKIALEGISQTMVQFEIPIHQNSQIGSFTPCQMEAGHEIRLMIYIENDLPEEIINGISKITFSDICIRGSEINSNVEKEEKPTYEIYPNPSFNAFTFSSNSFKHTPIQIEVYNRLGVLVEKLDLENSSKKYLFGSEYLPGMYLAKVTDGIQNSYMKIVKINR